MTTQRLAGLLFLIALFVLAPACLEIEGEPIGDGGEEPEPSETDSDGDCINDEFERREEGRDTDADGVPDYRDLDSDGDGITDEVESGNTECLLDVRPVDSDFDALPDYIDLDSDNDGILDSDEIVEFSDLDTDGDCINDELEGRAEGEDLDMDGVPNYQDLDSDGDGITDEVESGNTECLLDVPPVDTDMDGIPDFLDLDSDGDGILDADEAGAGDHCWSLTEAACIDDDDCQPVRGSEWIDDLSGQCWGASEFLGCIRDQACDDAETHFCDADDNTYLVSDSCGPAGMSECEEPTPVNCMGKAE